MSATVIGEILAQQARERPDAVALIDARARPARRVTFAELEREVSRASEWLQARGLKAGDGVLVFVPMSVDLYVALLALFRFGAVALLLDPSAGREHIERCCRRWPPRALLAVPKAHLLRLTSAALRAIPEKVVIGGWAPGATRWLPSGGVSPRPERAAPDQSRVRAVDAALVTFTSGSTGEPKAAVRTHGFLVAQHRALAPAMALEPGDVDLATLPVFTFANLASGLTTVIPRADVARPGAVDAAQIRTDVEAFGVTRITASPAFFERLLAANEDGKRALRSLRKLHTGGAPVFPRLLEQLQVAAPDAQVVAVYGSTEAEPIAEIDWRQINPIDQQAMRNGRGLLAGVPVSEIRLRIVRDRWGHPRAPMTGAEFAADTLPAGQPGEIVVAGEHVLRGYLGGRGDEETKFSVDGEIWHRTGDAGWLDDAGRLWLLGRCAAKISDARGELYPFAVECVAMSFAEVRRAAVLGVSGRRVLFVEASDTVVPALRAAVAWAHIDEVRRLEHIPVDRRHNAKIDYPALRRQVGKGE